MPPFSLSVAPSIVILSAALCVIAYAAPATDDKRPEFEQVSPFGGPRVFICQAGYRPDSTKTAVVWTWADRTGGRFALRSMPTGEVVLSGPLVAAGESVWGGQNWSADFSSGRREGVFRLEVTLNAGQTTIGSPEFPITAALYTGLAHKAMSWFTVQRCGVAVPGWHTACHLDDGVTRDVVKGSATWGKVTATLDGTGGWHDAGDYNKWFAYGWSGVYALTDLWERFRPDWRTLGEGLPDPLAEARHEVDLLIRLQRPDGSIPEGVIGWHPDAKNRSNNPWGFWGPPQSETDGRPGTGDERLIADNWVGGSHYVRMPAWTAATLARYAAAVKPFDADLAARSAQAASKLLGFYREHMSGVFQAKEPTARNAVAGLLAAEIALDRYEGGRSHREAASALAKVLSDQGGQWGDGQELHWPWMEVTVLLEYVGAYTASATGAEAAEIATLRLRLKAFADQVARLCMATRFQQMPAFQREGLPATEAGHFPGSWQGYNPYYAGTAVLLATAARVLSRPEYIKPAEQQVAWILGHNPLGVSMMCGVGACNPDIYHTRYSTLPGHEDGRIPGGVVNGLLRISDCGDIADASGDKAKAARYPQAYPVLAMPGLIGATHWWRTNEYWIPNNAWFILAVSRLAAR